MTTESDKLPKQQRKRLKSKKPGKGFIEYTQAEKAKALQKLQQNDFNYLQTERETGINRQALKRWFEKIGGEVYSVNKLQTQQAAESGSELSPEEKKKALETDIYTTKAEIIKRINTLIPSCKNVDDLAKALKVISDLDSNPGKKQPDEDEKDYKLHLKAINDAIQDEITIKINKPKHEKNEQSSRV